MNDMIYEVNHSFFVFVAPCLVGCLVWCDLKIHRRQIH